MWPYCAHVLPFAAEDLGRLVEVGDAVADVVERRRRTGPDRRAVEIDRSADGLDQLEVRGTGVDERDVDDPLLGRLAVDDDDPVQRRLVRLEAVDRAERLLEVVARDVEVVGDVGELHHVAEEITERVRFDIPNAIDQGTLSQRPGGVAA